MSSILVSSFTLLVIYSCLFSVVEVRVAKPVTYSFGDRLPKTTDLQSSSAESKATVVKRNPEIIKPVDIPATSPPQIIPKEQYKTRTSYTKKRVIPTKRQQHVPIPTIAQNIGTQKLESNKPLAKKKKLLQIPLTFSYNKDLKTAASHGGDYVVSENQPTHEAQGGEHQEDDNSHVEPKEWSFKRGGGKSRNAGHYSSKGDKGVENYKGNHDYEKAEQGYHDKEGHKGNYNDEAGNKKSHFYDDGLYGEYHKGEKGQKGAKYDEEGEHSKGHNTKGEHNVHKKEEYERKHEFYDEFHDIGDDEKHGAFHHENDYKKGGYEKSGHNKSGAHKDYYGKKGHHEKGEHYDTDKGHNIGKGHDEHYNNKSHYGKKGGHQERGKWGHKKGTEEYHKKRPGSGSRYVITHY